MGFRIGLAAGELLRDDARMSDKAEDRARRNPEPKKNHHPLERFLLPGESPRVAATAFIAEGAVVLGGVTVEEHASIWFGCVLRGDINRISIGPGTNIQDLTVIHVSDDYPAVVGANVSVGHRAIIHACDIGDETLVGMGAIVMDGARIGPRSIIAAGALVTKGAQIPEGSLVMGSPAIIIRTLSLAEQRANVVLAAKYVEVSARYRALRAGAGA
jgi:carbonic anhydrase/acetyltransferase-like protein (isoleucine patch superfamily)